MTDRSDQTETEGLQIRDGFDISPSEEATPRILIVTGLSGSGKSTALEALEDLGYFCIDNLPAPLIPKVLELGTDGDTLTRSLALVIDTRSLQITDNTEAIIDELKRQLAAANVLFLEADDDVLVRRFRETRRRHPVSGVSTVREGIEREKKLLKPLRGRADAIIDTTSHTVHTLKELIRDHWSPSETPTLKINVLSFGFKHGLPVECDLVFDVRFLSNPHFVEDLRPLTGKAPEVKEYVLSTDDAEGLIERLEDLTDYTIPRYSREGKSYLTIGIGCTGGKHRSVVISEELADHLGDNGWDAEVTHRDIEAS